jgi:hypothetical protein
VKNKDRNQKNKEKRKLVADENAGRRGARTHSEQLALLDKRLGVGAGAVKERARLQLLNKADIKPRSSR